MKVVDSETVDALIFDLGGVVIEINFDRALAYWADDAGKNFEDLKSKFSFDHFYECHERGEIDAAAYFNALRNSLSINLSDEQFEAGWNSIYVGRIPGIHGLLKQVSRKLPIYAFTNSNRAHQNVWSKKYSNVLDLFQAVFVSSEIGLRKPETAAFFSVADAIGIAPERIAFFDDSIENVRGAANAGMNAVHVRSITDVKERLRLLTESA